jgi:iron complex transport system substrate-binding protein
MSCSALVDRRTVVAGLTLALFACKKASSDEPTKAATPAPRLVTIGSAITETVFAVGRGLDVVGLDTSSLYPDAASSIPKIGYQRTVAAEGVLSLRPTLVIASHEAGPPAALEQLKAAGVRVEIVPLGPGIAGAKARIAAVAALVSGDASGLLRKLDDDLARQAQRLASTKAKPRVLALYARGAGSLQVFGRDTSADSMIALGGGANAVTGFEGAKAMSAEAVVAAAPDVILLPTRGLESLGGIDGLLKQPGLDQTPAGRQRRVLAIDDVLLLGFGPRLADAVKLLVDGLHPDLARGG